MSKIGVGDIVRLKSGGPQMTVTAVGPIKGLARGLVQVAWFDSAGGFGLLQALGMQTAVVGPDALVHVPQSVPRAA